MRLLPVAAFVLFAAPALAESYLPSPPPPAQQMPGFSAQAATDQYYRDPSAMRPAVNYQVPAIPNYLPMNRVDAQTASTQMASYTPSYAQTAPLLASEPYQPVIGQNNGVPQYAPQYAQPQQYVQPQQPYYPQQPANSYAMAPATVSAPYDASAQPSIGSTMSQPYSPGTMQGNPEYEYIDGPKPKPAMASEPGQAAFYGFLKGGVSFGGGTAFTTAGATYTNDYHTGWNVSGGAGYAFRPFSTWFAPRIEAEIGTIRETVDKHTVNGTAFKDPSAFGSTNTLTGMINGYIDILPYSSIFVPYIGGGAGFGYVDFDRHGVVTTALSNTDLGFAWNAGAGLGIHLGRGSVLDIGYRFVQVPDIDLTAQDTTKSTTDVDAHEITVGFRQSF